MAADYRPPFFNQVAFDPSENLVLQPVDVGKRIVSSGALALSVRSAACIHNMDQAVCMPQIVQKFIAETAALMRTRNEPSNVQKRHRDMARAIRAPAIVRSATTLLVDPRPRAGTRHSDVPSGSIRIDSSEWERANFCIGIRQGIQRGRLTTTWFAYQSH